MFKNISDFKKILKECNCKEYKGNLKNLQNTYKDWSTEGIDYGYSSELGKVRFDGYDSNTDEVVFHLDMGRDMGYPSLLFFSGNYYSVPSSYWDTNVKLP